MLCRGMTIRWLHGLGLPVALFVLLCSTTALATGEEDEAALATARGRERVAVLNRLATAEVEKQPESAGRHAQEALELARSLRMRDGEATATYLLAEAARVQGDHALALERYQLARTLFATVENPLDLGRSLRRIGDVYYFLAEYEAAMRSYLDAVEHFEALAKRDPRGRAPLHLAHLQAAIGNVLRASGDYPSAAAYYEKALSSYQQLGFQPGIAGAFYNLGLIRQDQQQYEEALRHYEEAQTVALALGDSYLESLALASAGSAWLHRGQLDLAEENIRKALAQNEASQRPRGILHNQVQLITVLRERARLSESLEMAERALELARRLGDRRQEADALREQALSREQAGDTMGALATFRRYHDLDQELLGADKASRLKKLQIAHETGRKEQEIRLLTAQRQRDRLVRSMVLVALASSLLVLGLLYSRYRLRAQAAHEIAGKNVELERAYARVEELSRTDELTGLPNRRAVLEILTREHARRERTGSALAAILADVDDFKRCNDGWGHECGDEVLRHLAQLLRSAVRATDTVGRWGGEEFLIVLPATDLEGARVVAEKIRATVAASPITWQGQSIQLTLTLGVCDAEGSIAQMLRLADEAMYRGKHEGKNQVQVAGSVV